ncbi:MAG: sporulation initiation factor Spo0A C-terminal domain-containing protein [Clostridiaceae bacterium]|nr:sporulation initiation factor Spo0A C-terminal domain-containing protein [Clostridiaceae bacterium]MDY3072822.1 sporulation initiation factor Spo0A C-terminal domain-containing protein [Eubacteriales bacterium]MDY5016806.1 sporulation initiation factor Spo0A C-terminal domain-containing protein [Eubacteriales bacterium]
MSSQEGYHALIVEKDEEVCGILERGLLRCMAILGTHVVYDADSALEAYQKRFYGLVLLEPEVLGKTCIDLIRSLRKMDRKILIVILTALPRESPELVRYWMEGADLIVCKPFSLSRLLDVIQERLHVKTDSDAENRCRKLLSVWGFQRRLLGTRFIELSSRLLYGNATMPMKTVYMEVAQRERTSPENVESAIRTAVQDAFTNGQLRKAYSSDKRPSNKEFLYMLAEMMVRHEND